MQKMGDRVEGLISLLCYGDRGSRERAARSLGDIGDRRALEPLISVLCHWDAGVRHAASEALNKISWDWPHSEAAVRQVPEFIAALKDKNREIRSAAAEVLARLGDDRALEPLIAALHDEAPSVYQSVVEALACIAWDWPKREAAKQQVPKFVYKLRNPNLKTLPRAVEVLAKIDPEALRSEPVKRQVPRFISALANDGEEIRASAARALGLVGDSVAVQPLIAALNDKSSLVRGAAARALGLLGDAIAVEPLMSILHGHSNFKDWDAAGEAVNRLRASNNPLFAEYPFLVCEQCWLRAEKRKLSDFLFKKNKWVVCRGCGSSGHLLTGVEHVIGLIGGTGEDIQHEAAVVTVHLWNETNQTARNADIDRLVIHAGGVSNYERAVNTVINALRGDVSRRADWCRKISVILEGSPDLSPGAIRMLEDTFAKVEART